jgi:hypothetical protein
MALSVPMVASNKLLSNWAERLIAAIEARMNN